MRLHIIQYYKRKNRRPKFFLRIPVRRLLTSSPSATDISRHNPQVAVHREQSSAADRLLRISKPLGGLFVLCIIHHAAMLPCYYAAQSHPFEYGSLPVFSSYQLSWYYLAWPFGLQFPIREASRRPSPRPPLVEPLRWMGFPRLLPSQPMPRRPSHPDQDYLCVEVLKYILK